MSKSVWLSNRVRGPVLGAVVVAVLGGLGALGSTGFEAHKPQLRSGAAWLASSAVGQLTLLDGASAEVAAQVQVAPAGNRVDVVQQDTSAYAVNRTSSTIRRVDGATFALTAPASPIPDAGDGLQALASPEVLYVLDTNRGVLTGTDPNTLANRGTLLPLASQVTAQAPALDSAGRLWAIGADGDLVWLDQGRVHVRHHAASPGGNAVLTLAGGTPVLVDVKADTATVLDPETGDSDGTTSLDLRPGDRIQVGGAPHARRLYLAAARGVLVVCDLAAADCSTAVVVGSAGADLGTPIEVDGRVFVPDYGTGQVWIVDLAGSQVVAKPQVVDPQTRFQLLTRDGVVFFNDPGSEHAGVIRLDGGIRQVAKYDPKDPDKGINQPGPGRSPTSSQPSSQPSNRPSSRPSTPASTSPAPSTSTTPTQDTRVNHSVQIVVSTDHPRVGESVTLKAIAKSRPGPTAAQWTFGDGGTAGALQTEHEWTAASTYQVSVKATFPDGRSTVSSLTIRVTTLPRLTVRVNGSGTVTGDGIACPPTCTVTVDPGSTIRLAAQPAAAGHTFAGWRDSCTGTAPACTLTVNADTAVSADFAAPPATAALTVSVAGAGTVTSQPAGIACPPTCTAPFTTGAQVQLTATAGSGFEVGSWSGACAGTSTQCQVTVAAGDSQASVTFLSSRPVLCQGQATITGTYLFHLEPTCRMNDTGGIDGDIFWEQIDPTHRQIAPNGGARIAWIGALSSAQFNTLTWEDLKNLSFSTAPIDGSDANNQLQDGTVFAVRTAAGHIAKVRVVSHTYVDNPWSRDLTIRYLTYG